MVASVIEKRKTKKTPEQKLRDFHGKEPDDKIMSILKLIRKNSLSIKEFKYCQNAIRNTEIIQDSVLILKVNLGLKKREIFTRPESIELLSSKEIQIEGEIICIKDIKSIEHTIPVLDAFLCTKKH